MTKKRTMKYAEVDEMKIFAVWPGETRNERIRAFLEYTESEGFYIIPFSGVKGVKEYNVFKIAGKQSETYNLILDGDWLEGYPKAFDSVIAYLKAILVDDPERKNYRFRMLGPNSLIYEDDIDKIVVYVNKENLVILHDGENVIQNMEMIPLVGSLDNEEAMNQEFLQPILAKF